jgi:hypothetical protein
LLKIGIGVGLLVRWRSRAGFADSREAIDFIYLVDSDTRGRKRKRKTGSGVGVGVGVGDGG